MKKLALRHIESGEFTEASELVQDSGSDVPGIALWDLDDEDQLLEAASIYVNFDHFEIVEVDVDIKVTRVVSNLNDAMPDEDDEDDE